MRGDGVHNEFLRILVELGPVGLGLVLFIAIPFARLGRQNFHWVSFYALAGIALGNVYTNATAGARTPDAVRRICGQLFLGGTDGASRQGGVRPSPTTTRYAAVALVVLALAALIEVALSFSRFPFTYGQRCFEVHPLAEDGWTQGVLRVPVPPEAASAELAVACRSSGSGSTSAGPGSVGPERKRIAAVGRSEYTFTQRECGSPRTSATDARIARRQALPRD